VKGETPKGGGQSPLRKEKRTSHRSRQVPGRKRRLKKKPKNSSPWGGMKPKKKGWPEPTSIRAQGPGPRTSRAHLGNSERRSRPQNRDRLLRAKPPASDEFAKEIFSERRAWKKIDGRRSQNVRYTREGKEATSPAQSGFGSTAMARRMQ